MANNRSSECKLDIDIDGEGREKKLEGTWHFWRDEEIDGKILD